MTANREHRAILLDPGGWADQQELERQRKLDLPAQYVRGIYFEHRVRFDHHPVYRAGRVIKYDGGTDKLGNIYVPFWPILARHLVRLQVSPYRYIHVRFLLARYRNEKAPLPTDFLSNDVLDLCCLFTGDLQQEFLQKLRDEELLIRDEARLLESAAGWDSRRAFRQALAKERGTNVTPIFRYSLAVENGFDDLACLYHDRALVQYVFERRFFDHLEIFRVPPALRTEGAELADLSRRSGER